MNTVKFELPANSLNGIKNLSGENEIRDYLNGVCISHSGNGTVNIFATDGIVMGFLQEGYISHSDCNIPFDIFLSNDILSKIKFKKNTTVPIEYDFETNKITISNCGKSISEILNNPVLSLKYRDYLNKLGNTISSPESVQQFDPILINKFSDFYSDFLGKSVSKISHVPIVIRHAGNPSFVKFSGIDNFWGVICPIVYSDDQLSKIKWDLPKL